MKSNGFTLIELLAVIVILAIIALIAVPIVIHIINDSKKSSEKESIKLYMDTVEKTITRKQMSDSTFKPEECTIVEKNLKCGEDTLEIDIKGQIPESGTIKIENNKLEGINLKLNGLYYQVKNGEVSDGTKDQVSSIGAICTGGRKSTTIGTKYSCEVKPGKSFNFYILSKDGDNVNLIMDRNICSSYTGEENPNGEPARGYFYDEETDTTVDEICWVDWTDIINNEHYNSIDGPSGAMTALYIATKDWINVPDMIMDYDDENQTYESIKTDINTKVTTITGKKDEYSDIIPITTIGSINEPLKARLPMLREVTSSETGCGVGYTYSGSCIPWLVDYLAGYYYDEYDKYSSNEKLGSIYGYWLLASAPAPDIGNALRVYESGFVDSIGVLPQDEYTGIRPVITVPASALGD